DTVSRLNPAICPYNALGVGGENLMKSYPTYRQREVLQFLMSGNWVPMLWLILVGEKQLGNLPQAGWIERSQDAKTGGHLYWITEAGRTAFRKPVPTKIGAGVNQPVRKSTVQTGTLDSNRFLPNAIFVASQC